MSKDSKSRDYSKYEKHYQKSWEDLPLFKGWLQKNELPDADPRQEAYCKVCRKPQRAQKADLEKHSKTSLHKKNMDQIRPVQKRITSSGITVLSDTDKSIDIKLAAHIAVHSAVRSVDHLGELLVSIGKGSKLETLRLHRTKCSKIIAHVISPSLLENLVEDLGDEGYSVIVDEASTFLQKYMGICIKYFNKKENDIIVDFLGLVDVVETTAEALYSDFVNFLKQIKIPVKNLLGVGTDGANAMCGKNHSFFTLLRDRSNLPCLQLIKCVPHSLHKSCSHACETALPTALEFLIRETRNWLSTPLRIAKYQEFYNLINTSDKELKRFRRLVKLSDTRWLAWENAVRRIVSQWLELKEFFKKVSESERCYTTQQLSLMYQDNCNYLYLLFLKSILYDVNHLNTFFQSSDQDVAKVYEEMRILVLSIASRIFTATFIEHAKNNFHLQYMKDTLANPLALRSPETMDYGKEFSSTLTVVNVEKEKLDDLYKRCSRFLVILLTEIVERIPNNVEILEKIVQVTPENILSVVKNVTIDNIPLQLLHKPGDIQILESELRFLRSIKWSEHLEPDILKNTSKFWASVRCYENAGGKRPLENLAKVVLKLLSFPLSNAVVERVFSVMNAIKSKARNKLNLLMLAALLRIRITFSNKKNCCSKFQPTDKMLLKFNAATMYGEKGPSSPKKMKTDDGEKSVKDAEIDVPENNENNEESLLETLTLFSEDSDICEVFCGLNV